MTPAKKSPAKKVAAKKAPAKKAVPRKVAAKKTAAELVVEVLHDTPDVEVAPETAHLAHRDRLTAMDWPEVAKKHGYPSVQAAVLAVTRYLQQAAQDQAAELGAMALTLELKRLDALQAAWWPMATLGDEKAAKVVLDVIKLRDKLLNLSGAEKVTEKQTIIITSGDDMAAQLRRMVESQQSDRTVPGDTGT